MKPEDAFYAVTTTISDREVQVDVVDTDGLHQTFRSLPGQWPVGAVFFAQHVGAYCITIEVMDEGGLTVW